MQNRPQSPAGRSSTYDSRSLRKLTRASLISRGNVIRACKVNAFRDFFFTPLYIRDLRETNASFSLSEHNGVEWGRGRERGFVLVIERTTGLSFIGYKYGSGGGGACDVTWLDTSRHGNWLLYMCVCVYLLVVLSRARRTSLLYAFGRRSKIGRRKKWEKREGQERAERGHGGGRSRFLLTRYTYRMYTRVRALPSRARWLRMMAVRTARTALSSSTIYSSDR